MIEHGSSEEGQHIAAIGRLVLVVERAPVWRFRVGDKIGWGDSERWLGTIVESEPDEKAVLLSDWHLAWKTDDNPNETFHWRGHRSARDTRWYPREQFVILETP